MTSATGPVRVQIRLRGGADYQAGDEARAAIEDAIASAHCAVRSAEVVVNVRDDPASASAAEVEAVLEVGHTFVHADRFAPTVSEAIYLLEHQLSAELIRHGRRAQTARRVPRRRRAILHP
ncbi:hypothetical protein GCM10009798_00080 [Nocardioides panacihumi]|uniref:HPF/RaiA family ribosome-associated protein n=1 Tax=Nocardioides panacihumi TaxID=400774 RepID=A0ABN2Q5M8_9ACTN